MNPTSCSNCQKPTDLCVCSEIRPIPTTVHVLILQHPQEPDKDLGTARLAHLALPNSTLKIGLSWRNLAAALGKEVSHQNWAVLYLGSGIKSPEAHHKKAGLHFVSKRSIPNPSPDRIDGIVLLDGTWSQAKALWWRNAWLLKLKRAILIPKQKSLYGELRKEPRKECLSTLETIAEALTALGEPPETGTRLRELFQALLTRKRATQQKPQKAQAPR